MRHKKYGLRLVLAALAVSGAVGITLSAPMGFNDLLKQPRPVATKRLAYGADPNQFGELWLPDGNGPHRVIIMIHGGCWQASLPGVELMAYIADDMRRSGMAVWNIEYRRLGNAGGGYPGTFLDIADAVDYLRQISDSYQLDLSHTVVMGHSAGGQLALWAAARNHLNPESPLYRAEPLPLQRVVTLAGINDLAAYRNNGPAACGGSATIDRLVGREGRPGADIYADTSPAAMLPIGAPQTIVSGSQDSIVPAAFGDDYARMAKASGDQVQVMDISGAGHFELIDPKSDAWAQVKAGFYPSAPAAASSPR